MNGRDRRGNREPRKAAGASPGEEGREQAPALHMSGAVSRERGRSDRTRAMASVTAAARRAASVMRAAAVRSRERGLLAQRSVAPRSREQASALRLLRARRFDQS